MYEGFYGFVHSPFTLAPDPRFLYRSESHADAIGRLKDAIARKEGFVVLTGDIGTGKTTICRALIEQFDPSTFTSLVLNPFVSIEELLRDVLLDFGVVSRDAIRSGRLAEASRHDLIATLHEFLLSLIPIRGSAVLIIDEAQHLSPELLEQIRLLSNLETNTAKLAQIVLVGQLNLLETLENAGMRQLDQRISLRARLKPLTRDEVDAYIKHRLSVASGASTVGFDDDAVAAVHGYAAGVPRVINLLCDRALMIAAHQRARSVSRDIVDDAARELGYQPARVPAVEEPKRRRVWPAAAAVAALTAILLLFAPIYKLVDATPPTAPAPPVLRVATPVVPPAAPDITIPVRIRSDSDY
jgi:general secretion pathway protein A